MHVQGSLLQDSDGEATRSNNGGNNAAVAGWRWPTRDSRKCLKRQRPALVVAGRCRLRSRRSWVRIPPGACGYRARCSVVTTVVANGGAYFQQVLPNHLLTGL